MKRCAELSAMLDELMWQGVEHGYQRLSADRAELASYRAETSEWTGADLGDLAASAADEYVPRSSRPTTRSG
jgi:hypothetical protein